MRLVGLLALILVLGGCAAELHPAPTAEVLPGLGQPAMVEAAGVRMVAQVGMWRERPAALEGAVTPILMTIENQRDAPLRVRHSDFALVSAGGRRFAALAPAEVQGAVPEAGPPAYAPSRSVFVATRDRAGRAILYDPSLVDPAFAASPTWGWTELPTAEMIELGLPERALEPHTQVAGFLYFPLIPRGTSSVELRASLVDDGTGGPVATLAIPFVVR